MTDLEVREQVDFWQYTDGRVEWVRGTSHEDEGILDSLLVESGLNIQ